MLFSEKSGPFAAAYWQALLFLEVMNVYVGVMIDKLWVGHSRFWMLPGLEDVPFVQTWRQVLRHGAVDAPVDGGHHVA